MLAAGIALGSAAAAAAPPTATPTAPPAGPLPALIPREAFFGPPDRTGPRISPDGERLAYLAPHGGVQNVWVQTIGAHDARPVTWSTKRPIRRCWWAANGEQILYRQDADGDENHHLYAVDLDGDPAHDLTPMDGVQARLVAVDRDHPDEILVAVNDRTPRAHDVWRIDTRSGEGTRVLENTRGYTRFLADATLTVRVASRTTTDGGEVVHLRDGEAEPWYELVRWGLDEAESSRPLGISRDGGTVYLLDARTSDTSRLYAYTDGPDGPSYARIAGDERADVARVLFDPGTRRPQAVAFDHARRRWRFLDGGVFADWATLRRVADGEPSIVSRDRDDGRWVVAFERDDGPIAYYLYERAAREATFLFVERPPLAVASLAKMEPVTITARDGLPLVSYLTKPIGSTGPVPMVLLVHGGPWARNRWGYHPVHQWLTNRGYAVLSVNFRGSTGFGKRHLNAGNRQWSGRMHDDLIDAVNWAVSEGVADPDRVAIMGTSYGGYATLVGLTVTPEFFAAGVDIVGPSHVPTLLDSIPPYWEPIRARFDARVGTAADGDLLEMISPLNYVHAIRRPLLIGHGRNDPRVKEDQSRQIVVAMQSRGLPVTYVLFPDEGHGFRRPANRMAFYAITEAFLAQHLGGRFEPIGEAVDASSARLEAGGELIPGL
ncbi:MAG: S9 family peptidase [Planctomycetes bacterium]|nr:S9 family peptidase [Planctomycetota bacterium]